MPPDISSEAHQAHDLQAGLLRVCPTHGELHTCEYGFAVTRDMLVNEIHRLEQAINGTGAVGVMVGANDAMRYHHVSPVGLGLGFMLPMRKMSIERDNCIRHWQALEAHPDWPGFFQPHSDKVLADRERKARIRERTHRRIRRWVAMDPTGWLLPLYRIQHRLGMLNDLPEELIRVPRHAKDSQHSS